MLTDKDNLLVEGLLFKYTHFYGSYKYVADSRKWYRNEIRIIRNTKNVLSYKDAQGFRKRDNTKLKVKSIDAYIYHYGWVKPPSVVVVVYFYWVCIYLMSVPTTTPYGTAASPPSIHRQRK